MNDKNSTTKLNLTGLNALRGLAAISIVIFHVHGIPNLPLPPQLSFIQNFLGLGVPLFFVISAFSLFLSTRSRVGSDGWLSAYVIRRVMRIAPLFYLVAIFYLFFIPLHFGVYISPMSFLGTISFLFNLMPGQHESMVWAGWTIGVEMLFYLVLPYLLIFVKNTLSATVALIAGLIVSSIFYKFYLNNAYPPGYAYMSFMSSIGVFMYGIFGYFIFTLFSSKPLSHKRLIGSIFLAASLALIALNYTFESKLVNIFGNRSNIWGLFFVSIVVSQCLNPILPISNKLTSHLGKLSFGLYLFHPPIIELLKPFYQYYYGLDIGYLFAFTASALTTLAILIPIAHLASTIVEKRGIDLGERIIRRRMANDNRIEASNLRSAPEPSL